MSCLSIQISASEVDFWSTDPEELQLLHDENLYPPRFVIRVGGDVATEDTFVQICIRGVVEDLDTELELRAHRQSLQLMSSGRFYVCCRLILQCFQSLLLILWFRLRTCATSSYCLYACPWISKLCTQNCHAPIPYMWNVGMLTCIQTDITHSF